MSEIRIEWVDERDSNWEESNPLFRVYLHGQSDPSNPSWWTSTYDITGADVLQVIDWAQRQAGDSLTYAVALVYDDEARVDPLRARGLVWLVGMDANDDPWNEREVDTMQRMLARRGDPERLRAADLMPPGVPDPYNDGTQSR